MAQTNGHDGTNGYNGVNGHSFAPTALEDRPVSDLFQDLARQAGQLVNLQLDMAKAEISQNASQAGKNVGFLAAGGFVIYAGFLAIILAAIIGLANLIPAWLSALIVGVVVAAIGYVLVRKGLDGLKHLSLAPEKTVATLQEDKRVLQGEQAP